MPSVSSSQGTFAVGNLIVPLAFDSGSFFSLTDPLTSSTFGLTSSGTLAAGLLATGISLGIHVGFIALTTTLQ